MIPSIAPQDIFKKMQQLQGETNDFLATLNKTKAYLAQPTLPKRQVSVDRALDQIEKIEEEVATRAKEITLCAVFYLFVCNGTPAAMAEALHSKPEEQAALQRRLVDIQRAHQRTK